METQGVTVAACAAVLSAVLLAALALLHAYWGTGGLWPARDPVSLARMVVGAGRGRGGGPPPAWACFAVAGLLTLAAWTVLAAGLRWPGLPLPGLWRAGARAVAGVLAARGLVGYLDTRLRPATLGAPFARLNRRIYSPLCLLLALLAALAVWPR